MIWPALGFPDLDFLGLISRSGGGRFGGDSDQEREDSWAGAIYVAMGGAALWIGGSDLTGISAEMGPGYFRRLRPESDPDRLRSTGPRRPRHGEAVGRPPWNPLSLVLVACALLGALLQTAGLIAALLAFVLVSALASRRFGFDGRRYRGWRRSSPSAP